MLVRKTLFGTKYLGRIQQKYAFAIPPIPPSLDSLFADPDKVWNMTDVVMCKFFTHGFYCRFRLSAVGMVLRRSTKLTCTHLEVVSACL